MPRCAACGQDNPDGFRFCGACGTSLAAPAPARAERRLVTVLFCDVVNTASRLQGVAPEGGVVVGEATFRATGRLFDYQELTPVRVKGKANPVPVWRLLGARSRTGIEAGRRPDTPFVGREAEQDLLRRLFERTLAG